MLYPSTLKYGDFYYNFDFAEIAEEVATRFSGISLAEDRTPRATCTVEDGKLVLQKLMLFVRQSDLGKALCCGHFAKHERKERFYKTKSSCGFEDSQLLTFENLHIPLRFSGEVAARQIYVDEVNVCGVMHKETSTFVFENGILCAEKSEIQQRTERFIEQFIWREGMDIGEGKADTHRLFYINPSGTVAQNNAVINAWVAYRRCPGSEAPAVKEILKYKPPVLRTEYMSETAPCSGEFKYRCIDVTDIVAQYQKRT